MKLTTARLKKLIREEFERMQEAEMDSMEKINFKVPAALQALDKEYGNEGRPEREKESNRLKAVAADLGMKVKTDEISDQEAVQQLKNEFAGNPDIMSMIRFALKGRL